MSFYHAQRDAPPPKGSKDRDGGIEAWDETG